MRYFGGKSKIANYISTYINNLIKKGFNGCSILEENKKYQDTSQTILTLYTHTLC